MLVDKKFISMCSQLMINSYKGKYGKVVDILDTSKDFIIKEVDGYIGTKDDTLFIVFKGSDGFQDWIDNFKFDQVSYPYLNDKTLKVHDGFIHQYGLVRNYIHSYVQSYEKVVILGHSLGGALSLLCSFDIKLEFPNKDIVCVPFAAPKVGNPKFAKKYEDLLIDTYRFTYKNDLVPRVPPWWTIFPPFFVNYKQTAKEHWLCDVDLRTEFMKEPVQTIFGNIFDHYPNLYDYAINNYKYDLNSERNVK